MAVDRRDTAGLDDQGGKVLGFPRDGVRCRVGALTSPTAVVVEHAEPLRELLGQWLRRRAIAEDAADHDDGRSSTEAVEGDPRPVYLGHVPGHRFMTFRECRWVQRETSLVLRRGGSGPSPRAARDLPPPSLPRLGGDALPVR